MATTASTYFAFTAGLMDASNLSLLQKALGSGEESWPEGTSPPVAAAIPTATQSTSSSKSARPARPHHESTWSEHIASDLAYGDVYEIFIVSVPIPGAVWFLGAGLAGLRIFRRKKPVQPKNKEHPCCNMPAFFTVCKKCRQLPNSPLLPSNKVA